jgi:hypothetical protein
MKLGVAARDGLRLETGLRDLEIMLLGISSCGIDPAGTEEQGICCTSVLSETTGVTRLASRQSPPARRGGDGERITQGAPAVDGDGVSAPAKAAAAGDCGLSLHIALLVENWQSLGDQPPPRLNRGLHHWNGISAVIDAVAGGLTQWADAWDTPGDVEPPRQVNVRQQSGELVEATHDLSRLGVVELSSESGAVLVTAPIRARTRRTTEPAKVLGEVEAMTRELSLDGCWHRLTSCRVLSPELGKHTLIDLSNARWMEEAQRAWKLAVIDVLKDSLDRDGGVGGRGLSA